MTTFSGEEYCGKVSKYKWFMDWRQNIGHEHVVLEAMDLKDHGLSPETADRMVGEKHEKVTSWDNLDLGNELLCLGELEKSDFWKKWEMQWEYQGRVECAERDENSKEFGEL